MLLGKKFCLAAAIFLAAVLLRLLSPAFSAAAAEWWEAAAGARLRDAALRAGSLFAPEWDEGVFPVLRRQGWN